MRIACLQYDPQLMNVELNQTRAGQLIDARLGRGEVDVLLLPEMAFSGYCFQSKEEILPFCEEAMGGVTATWCAAIARSLDTNVIAGFPESGPDGHLYNALVVVDRQGRVVHVYRKHFLYTTDETWATEGPEFSCVDIPDLGPSALGICMDLNPKQFLAPHDRFEFASALFDPPLKHHETPSFHHFRANWILVINNWLRVASDLGLSDEEHSRYLINYWAYRFTPALDHPAIVAIANRVGVERDTHFAGSSCVFDLKRRALLGSLNGVEEDVLIVETPNYR